LANAALGEIESAAGVGVVQEDASLQGIWRRARAPVTMPRLLSMVVTDRLSDELRAHQAGKTEVRDAKVRFEVDASGEEALYVVLTLANPTRGQATWPIDDLWALRRHVLEIKTRLERDLNEPVELPWFVVFEPERASDLEDEGLREIIDLNE